MIRVRICCPWGDQERGFVSGRSNPSYDILIKKKRKKVLWRIKYEWLKDSACFWLLIIPFMPYTNGQPDRQWCWHSLASLCKSYFVFRPRESLKGTFPVRNKYQKFDPITNLLLAPQCVYVFSRKLLLLPVDSFSLNFQISGTNVTFM